MGSSYGELPTPAPNPYGPPPPPNPYGPPPPGPYDPSSYGELPTPAPHGDLPANPAQGDSSLIPERLPTDGHVRPDGSVHPGVPPQPEQHHGPPPPSTYGDLPWLHLGYTTAPPYGYADTS